MGFYRMLRVKVNYYLQRLKIELLRRIPNSRKISDFLYQWKRGTPSSSIARRGEPAIGTAGKRG